MHVTGTHIRHERALAVSWDARRTSGVSLQALITGNSPEGVELIFGNTGDLWSDAFFATAILAAWLAGVFVRGRRETAVHTARIAAAERQAERAVADVRP